MPQWCLAVAHGDYKEWVEGLLDHCETVSVPSTSLQNVWVVTTGLTSTSVYNSSAVRWATYLIWAYMLTNFTGKVVILLEGCETGCIPPSSLQHVWVTITAVLCSTSKHHYLHSYVRGALRFDMGWNAGLLLLSGCKTWWWYGKCCVDMWVLVTVLSKCLTSLQQVWSAISNTGLDSYSKQHHFYLQKVWVTITGLVSILMHNSLAICLALRFGFGLNTDLIRHKHQQVCVIISAFPKASFFVQALGI